MGEQKKPRKDDDACVVIDLNGGPVEITWTYTVERSKNAKGKDKVKVWPPRVRVKRRER
jgi:hypothetical protein